MRMLRVSLAFAVAFLPGGPLAGQHRAEWPSPPSKIPGNVAVDAPLLGNGDMAAAIGGPPEAQRYYLAKNDFWRLKSSFDQSGPRPFGILEIRIPALADAAYSITQEFPTAHTKSAFTRPGGAAVTMRSWVAATRNVLVVELAASGSQVDVEATLTPGAGGESGPGWAVRRFATDVDIPAEAAAAIHVIGAPKQAFPLHPGRPVTVVVAMESRFKNPGFLDAARRMAAAVNMAELEKLRRNHEAWWAGYWARSSVSIGDAAIEKLYGQSLYTLASCSRDPEFPPGLFGSWVTTDTPAWNGDYHLNYNHVAPFYGLYSSNRIEQADPEDAPLLDFLERGKYYARSVTRTRGVLYPVGIGPKGIETTRDAGPYRNTPNFENGGLFFGQKSNAAYSVVNIAQRWRLTQDPEYARRTYPLVRAVADFWEDYLKFEDGRYVIYRDSVHEGSGEDVNPVLSLGLVPNALECALEMSRELGVDEGRREKWTHILAHMSGFPTQERDGKKVFRYTERGMPWYQNNTLGIQHIYPGNAIGPWSPADLVETARNTLQAMNRWLDTNGSNSFFPAAVRAGCDPDVILEQLRVYARHTYPNGFQRDNPHGIENTSTVPNTINEMLLMSHAGGLRVFPLWPANRPAGFHQLRARGAFLVSSEWKAGSVAYVRVLSERGRELTLVNPWPGRRVTVHRKATMQTLSGERLNLKTQPGEELTFGPEMTN
jgi:alpha-L-fucosidase 2